MGLGVVCPSCVSLLGGLEDGIATGLVSGWDGWGTTCSPDTVRNTVENGDRRGRCGEEKKKSLPGSSWVSWGSTNWYLSESAALSSDVESSELVLERSKDTPPSSSSRLTSLSDLEVLLLVEDEGTRSWS
jgi:hypothetical protein